jgi:two-component system, NarL family, nitrate/nitrite response regulator NarL
VPDPIVRVIVIDHFPLYRDGLVQALVGTRFHIVAEGGTASELSSLAAAASADLVLLDISSSADAVKAAAEAMRRRPGLKVVALTASDHQLDVSDALRAGFSGYVLKGVTRTELNAALDTICRGQPYITPALASRMLMQSTRPPQRPPVVAPEEFKLTQREKQILVELCNGLTNREIAQNLGLTVATMKFYMNGIFRKLKVRNRVEALIKAQELGLTPGQS